MCEGEAVEVRDEAEEEDDSGRGEDDEEAEVDVRTDEREGEGERVTAREVEEDGVEAMTGRLTVGEVGGCRFGEAATLDVVAALRGVGVVAVALQGLLCTACLPETRLSICDAAGAGGMVKTMRGCAERRVW